MFEAHACLLWHLFPRLPACFELVIRFRLASFSPDLHVVTCLLPPIAKVEGLFFPREILAVSQLNLPFL